MKLHRLSIRNAGFTIIEFLVASSLAIIVIMAAGGTYFMTRKLNHSAQQRLDIQQNLRNAALQITRDARLAGSFGCYSTGNDATIVSDITAPDFSAVTTTEVVLDANKAEGFGIYKGTYKSMPTLFFIYGQGETGITRVNGLTNANTNNITGLTLASGSGNNAQNKNLDPLRQTINGGGFIVLSSCRSAYALRTPRLNGDNLPVSLTNAQLSTQDSGTIAISKLHAVAYSFNQAGKQVFRMELGNNGQWQEPQLISKGINGMDIGFGYTQNCPASFSDAASTTAETFTFSNTTAEKKLPSLVQIRFNYDLDIPPKKATAAPGATAPAITTADYFINATVRGGNSCGNRMPLK